MSNKIILKKSSVTSKVPLASDLEYGEVAINYADGKIYYKTDSNQIKVISSEAVMRGDFGAFALPTVDGESGQTLITDGNGNVTWTSTASQSVNFLDFGLISEEVVSFSNVDLGSISDPL